MLSTLGDNIRMERLRKRYSQEKLSELSGISCKYIMLIEKARVNPTIYVVYCICSALEVDFKTLLS